MADAAKMGDTNRKEGTGGEAESSETQGGGLLPARYREKLNGLVFLRGLFKQLEEGERIELRLLGREGKGARPVTYPRREFFPDAATAWTRAQEWSVEGDVYFGVAPRRGEGGGTAERVARLLCLWADLDFKGGHTLESRRGQMRAMECEPSIVVESGGGLHAYWLLDRPLQGDAEGKARAQEAMRALAARLGADNVSDAARILRVPGTLNYKYDPPRRTGVVGWRPALRYSIEALEGMARGNAGGSDGIEPQRREEAEDVTMGAAQSLVLSPHPLPQHSALDVGAALRGVPEGQRDITLFRLACKLRRAGVPVEMAARMMVEAARNCTPAFDEKEAVAKAVRAYHRYPVGPEEELEIRDEDGGQRREKGVGRSDVPLQVLLHGSPLPAVPIPEASGYELVNAAMQEGTEPVSLPLLRQGGYIIEGWSHLLAGYPRSGKTELLVRVCAEWLYEGKTVVYISEEPRSIWQYRLPRIACDWTNLQVIFGLGRTAEDLFARAYGRPASEEQIVVVDTMRNLLSVADETDNSKIAAALNPWIAAARATGKTLVVAHHMRKGSGEHGEGIAGGHALLGVFDIALELSREDKTPNRRRIKGYARLLQPPEMVYELQDDGTMRFLGDPGAVRFMEVMARVKEALDSERWVKTSEVRDMLGEPGPSLEQTRAALLKLAHEGVVERDPPVSDTSVAGRTVTWRRALRESGETDAVT